MMKAISKLDFTIVAARYKEDVSWLVPFAPKVSIQNKGDLSSVPKELQPCCRQLPNIGLDQFCYVNYIVENYDKLPQIILFTQANPIDHLDVYEPYLSMSHVKTVDTFHPYSQKLTAETMTIELLKQVHFHGFTQIARAYRFPNGHWCTMNHILGGNTDTIIPIRFGDWFEKYVGEPFLEPDKLVWFKNGIFGVSKQHILSRPKYYYERLRNTMTKRKENILHYFERSWYYILNLGKQLHPFNLETTLKTYLNVFRYLDEMYMAEEIGVLKPPRFFIDVSGFYEEYVHRQTNLHHFGKTARFILQSGFQTGHSLALMMLVNPSSKVLVVDDFTSEYAKKSYEFLKATLGPQRFLDRDAIDDTQRFDLFHFDNENTLKKDVTNFKKYALKKSIVVIDDYQYEHVKDIVLNLKQSSVVKSFNCIIAEHEGKSHQFVCKYKL